MKSTFKKGALGLLVGTVLAAAPMAVFAEGSDVQSQITALLEQIKSLQQVVLELSKNISKTIPQVSIVERPKLEQPTVAPRWCAIARSLAQGAQGEDVSDFQAFLKDLGYLSVEPTGYFGPVTAGAVAKWQSAEGLDAVGVVGPLTRERMLKKWCGGSVVDNSYPQERLITAEPQRGEAPLTVVFSTWLSGFRVNTISYTIDFGDGFSERAADCSAPADACISPGQNKHTYTQNGTYTAMLNKITDPCAGQTACRAAIHEETVAKLQIVVGPQACTKEYRPVCGAKQIQCITTPCNPIPTTYGNECMMKADGASFLYEGACKDTSEDPANDRRCKAWYDGCNNCSRQSADGPAMCTLRACLASDNATLVQGKAYCTEYFDGVGGDRDVHGCIPSAGYSWCEAKNKCLRSWEEMCELGNKPPVISSFSGPTTLRVNETGTWEVKASDPENGTLTYNVSWGDDGWGLVPMMMSAGAREVFVQTSTFTHSYAYAGVFSVGIVVRDSAGMSAKTSTSVKVGDDTINCNVTPLTKGPESIAWQQKCRPTACTMEYAPVCGMPSYCFNLPPNAGQCSAFEHAKTYSNRCMMNAAGASYLHEGTCEKEESVACTADAKRCPDGSYVGRTGPNCEFVCPPSVQSNYSVTGAVNY